MARTAEFYHDPDSPTANAIRPTVFAVVRDATGRLLLARRTDTRNWELPGGEVELGESATDAVLREVAEETALRISVTRLSGVYTDPQHRMAYESGEVRQQFAIVVHAVPIDGDPHPDHDEMTDASWFDIPDIDALPIHPSMRLRIDHALFSSDTVQLV
ncbi:MAG TPA: NUDIX domain-containing protein [Pseudonocardiaceae bacterium]|jgi:8-oxo-dGTP pyrophosphatase MutT (NUDIX family)|nr:NUDIX domain-containing protein [Pseudonocardiaceae bacterium]